VAPDPGIAAFDSSRPHRVDRDLIDERIEGERDPFCDVK
jgi:hypothetical protein